MKGGGGGGRGEGEAYVCVTGWTLSGKEAVKRQGTDSYRNRV